MTISMRRVLPGVLGALAAAIGGPIPAEAQAASDAVVKIEALPGTIVRWSVPGTKRCGMGKRSWAALQETCYYPIDLLQKAAVLKVSRHGAGPAAHAQISVLASPYETENIDLGEIPQANPSPADLRRNSRDQALVDKVWTRPEGPARFTLPLGPLASPMPEGKSFGTKWIFDGKPDSSEDHSGADYTLAAGTPVAAVADGTVVIAEDLFFTGNAVFIDHGDALISMYFHLAELKVQAGQDVKKGEILGLVGSTGRVTGPHLHLGVRWHGARINPELLLDDPAKIPAIGP
jgi:murein DD-endopeptidase MepM/ murein hydrolase activator NlpD